MTTPDIVLFVLLWGGAFVCFLMVATIVWAIRRNGTPKRRPLALPIETHTIITNPPILEVRGVIANVRFAQLNN